MSYKQRGKNRQKKAKQESTTPSVQPKSAQAQSPKPIQDVANTDRFLFANEIGERLGGVGATCVRQWRRDGKIKLRKMFGTKGQWGMSESELVEFIRRECKG